MFDVCTLHSSLKYYYVLAVSDQKSVSREILFQDFLSTIASNASERDLEDQT